MVENGGWAAREIKLLGTERDKVLAKRLGRTTASVTVKRVRLGILVYPMSRKLR